MAVRMMIPIQPGRGEDLQVSNASCVVPKKDAKGKESEYSCQFFPFNKVARISKMNNFLCHYVVLSVGLCRRKRNLNDFGVRLQRNKM